jgi:flavin reductase (DIM6/NTAB) family NADH-FMN oxidoreductase RutF
MRKNFGAKPFLYPQPVLIVATYDENGKPNAMTAAWGGICGMNKITIILDSRHKTSKNIRATGAFTVSIADAKHVIPCDYVGIVSANNEPNKMEKAGFTTSRSEFVNAPIINELPLALECNLLSMDEDSGQYRVVGEIVNVSADESILGEDGLIDPLKVEAITYDPVRFTYIKLGEIVGQAFRDGAQLK